MLDKRSNEMTAVLFTQCLPTLIYGCENAVFCENTQTKMNVTRNNCLRHTFNCCWRESVKPLQYFWSTCQRRIRWTKLNYFSGKMYNSNNLMLYSLSRPVWLWQEGQGQLPTLNFGGSKNSLKIFYQ